MRALLARVRAWSALFTRQQITRTGLLFSLTALIVGLAAFASANNLLFLILAAMLATLLVSGFVSRLGLAGLELEILHPEHISAGRKISGRVAIQNDKLWIPSFSIQLSGTAGCGLDTVLYFPCIQGHTRVEEPVGLWFPKRGIYGDDTFYLSTRFPFGFAARRAPVRVLREVVVYPSVDPQPELEALLAGIAGEIQSYFRGLGNDFHRIRPYEPFESARHVDWRATAHTGELQVREFAREEEQSIHIALDLELPAGDIFENAVECCAYLAWRLTSGTVARVHFTTQEVAMRVPEEGEVYTILKYLAVVAPVKGKALPAAHDRESIHIIFTGQPERFAEAGWNTDVPRGSFVVGLASLSAARRSADGGTKTAATGD